MVIVHMMSTVMVLSEGKAAEKGTLEELMRRNGFFANMVDLQTKNHE
mgnify:CR=1 FL=1